MSLDVHVATQLAQLSVWGFHQVTVTVRGCQIQGRCEMLQSCHMVAQALTSTAEMKMNSCFFRSQVTCLSQLLNGFRMPGLKTQQALDSDTSSDPRAPAQQAKNQKWFKNHLGLKTSCSSSSIIYHLSSIIYHVSSIIIIIIIRLFPSICPINWAYGIQVPQCWRCFMPLSCGPSGTRPELCHCHCLQKTKAEELRWNRQALATQH